VKAPLPYRFCAVAGCCEMTLPDAMFCLLHTLPGPEHDLHFPDAEILSPDASRETNPTPPTVPGDAVTE